MASTGSRRATGSHAYGVLALHRSPTTGARLVRIRNPHATTEWKGRWNEAQLARDRPAVLRECKLEVADDGVFVMLVEDVGAYAAHIDGVRCFSGLPPGRVCVAP